LTLESLRALWSETKGQAGACPERAQAISLQRARCVPRWGGRPRATTATAGQHHRHRDLTLRNVNLPAKETW